MFKITLAVVEKLKDELRRKEYDFQFEKQVQAMNIRQAKDDLRKEMEKRLIESDLERVKAQTELSSVKERLAESITMFNGLIVVHECLIKSLTEIKSSENKINIIK